MIKNNSGTFNRRSFLFIVIFFCCILSSFSQTLKEKAENGDKVAQYQYGKKLIDGRNATEKEKAEGVIWITRSANQGYAVAQCQLGYCYNTGMGVMKNGATAVAWYQTAADQGESTAQYNLGVCYATGNGVTQSKEKAFIWYKKAAEQGQTSAENALAKCYYYGNGTTANLNLAFQWFKKSSEKNEEAMYYLGECYYYGYGTTKDMKIAAECYKKTENVNAQYKLALMMLKGEGIEKDSIEAANLLVSSAAGGFCIPGWQEYYEKDKANKKAEEKLVELCGNVRTFTQGYFAGTLGCLYRAKQDYQNAEIYFKRSISAGSCLGFYGLGIMYFYVAANSPSLYPYYNNSGPLGLESYMEEDNSAILEYAKTKKWSDTDNVTYWLEEAITGCDDGSSVYGVMGYNLYDHLLFAYVDEVGTKRNMAKATEIAALCIADEGVEYSYNACTVLRMALDEPELEKNVFRICQDLGKQIGNNKEHWAYAEVMGLLGRCYYKGTGIAKDYNLAFKYLSAAANEGDSEAMRLLAACYRYGRGTAESQAKEKEWVEKAAQYGDDKAKKIKERRESASQKRRNRV
ncbi:MAG: sel1 repeat family protein [Bacteroidales bacterium]|nr:sel1 repeat family protein [Bacteroidales bacterium]